MTTVQLEVGALRGRIEQGNHVFRGIPYAEPLTGLARWLPPQPRQPWQGVRDALEYGPACMQFSGGGFVFPFPQSRRRYFMATGGGRPARDGDDSLLLNVWSPDVDRKARLPVMVWIHGGGFAQGAANAFYDGAPFASRGVVCIAIQYRLGAAGFLHGSGLFEGEVCADNRAFLDQIEALRWVQQHIEAFGGDPGNVTLFGESAGAFAIYQLAASPKAKGLFKRAIAMGGMAGTCAPAADYHRLSRDALADVGVKAGDVQALAALDRKQIQTLQKAMARRVFKARPADQYGRLSREKVGFFGAATGTDFLPQAPLDAYPQGTPNDIDLMLGTCAHDGRLFSLMLPMLPSLSARLFSKNFIEFVPGRDLPAAWDFYRQQMQGASEREVLDQVNNDAFYRMPTLAAAEAHAGAHPGKTWHYQLDYVSVVKGLGAIHGIDVALLFGTCHGVLADDAETAQLTEQLRRAMISFATSGRPAAKGLPEWTPFERASRPTLVFDRRSRLASDLDAPLRKFWQTEGSTP
ncbi:MAG: carboxylesterase family protein [Pseudomonadota bacterium]